VISQARLPAEAERLLQVCRSFFFLRPNSTFRDLEKGWQCLAGALKGVWECKQLYQYQNILLVIAHMPKA
jgi:hypothetical protein